MSRFSPLLAIVAVTIMLVASSCQTGDYKPTSNVHVAEAEAAPVPIYWTAGPAMEELEKRLSTHAHARCKELGVKDLKAIYLRLDPAPVDVHGYSVLLGWYDREEICHLYIYVPSFYGSNGAVIGWRPTTMGQLLAVLDHEILHHYDWVTAKREAPEDHSAEFEQRLKALGWK